MKQARIKHRLLPIAMLALALALVVGICGFLVPAPVARADEATTRTTKWHHNRSAALTVMQDVDLVTFNDDAVYVNTTNILEFSDHTAYFQLRVNKSVAWSAIMLLDAFTVEDPAGGKAAWKGLSFNDSSASLDFDNHMRLIFQDGGAQYFSAHASTLQADGKTAIRGIKNPYASWSDALVGVEIHIGEGGDDKTYIKVNGTKLYDEDDADVWSGLTTSTFANGCFIALHLNLTDAKQAYIGEIGAPVVTEQAAELKALIDYTKAEPIDKDVSFTVRNLTNPSTATLKINGTAVDAQYYTTAAVSGDDHAQTYTVKKAFWKTVTLARNSYLTVDDTNGQAVVMLQVQNAPPPVWKGASYIEQTQAGDAAYTFTFLQKGVTASDLKVYGGVHPDAIDTSKALVADTDYTLVAGENDEYTLTIKQAYLDEVLKNYNGHAFRIGIGEDTLKATMYRKPAAQGWVTRTKDVTGAVTADEYYTYIPMNRIQESTLSARVFHSVGVPVNKPIFVEFSGLPQTGGAWTMFNVAKSLDQMDYFKDNVTASSALQAIFFAGRTDLQKLHGFVSAESTNANYTETKQTGNVIELFFGDGTAEGYMKVNGELIGKPSAKQEDFPQGVAYIGWFNGNPVTFDFKLNTNLNAIAVDSADDSGFKMDIAEGTDFTVKLINYAAADTIVVKHNGVAIDAADYTFNPANGSLTVKAAFFGKIPFSKEGVFSVWNDTAKTGTQFTLVYSSSNMKSSAVAFATKGNIADASFALPAGVTVTSVLGGDGEELSDTQYTVSDGKVVIRKEAIADAYGVSEYIAVAGKELYPLYVYVQDFADGGYKTGAGTVVQGTDAIVADGEVSYVPMKAFNFLEGVTTKVDFKEIPGYYNGGRNYNKTGYVRYGFYDPYSGNTLVFVLYTNYPADEVTKTDTALYRSFSMTDREGKIVIAADNGAINIEKSPNPAPLGEHTVKFTAVEGNLEITVDNARKITVEGLGTFNLSASILTVSTPASVAEATSKVGIAFTNEATLPGGNTPTPPDDNPAEKPKKKGCGSEMTATAALAGVLLLAAAACAVLLRRKEHA